MHVMLCACVREFWLAGCNLQVSQMQPNASSWSFPGPQGPASFPVPVPSSAAAAADVFQLPSSLQYPQQAFQQPLPGPFAPHLQQPPQQAFQQPLPETFCTHPQQAVFVQQPTGGFFVPGVPQPQPASQQPIFGSQQPTQGMWFVPGPMVAPQPQSFPQSFPPLHPQVAVSPITLPTNPMFVPPRAAGQKHQQPAGAGNLGAGELGAGNLEAGNLGAPNLGAGSLGAGAGASTTADASWDSWEQETWEQEAWGEQETWDFEVAQALEELQWEQLRAGEALWRWQQWKEAAMARGLPLPGAKKRAMQAEPERREAEGGEEQWERGNPGGQRGQPAPRPSRREVNKGQQESWDELWEQPTPGPSQTEVNREQQESWEEEDWSLAAEPSSNGDDQQQGGSSREAAAGEPGSKNEETNWTCPECHFDNNASLSECWVCRAAARVGHRGHGARYKQKASIRLSKSVRAMQQPLKDAATPKVAPRVLRRNDQPKPQDIPKNIISRPPGCQDLPPRFTGSKSKQQLVSKSNPASKPKWPAEPWGKGNFSAGGSSASSDGFAGPFPPAKRFWKNNYSFGGSSASSSPSAPFSVWGKYPDPAKQRWKEQ